MPRASHTASPVDRAARAHSDGPARLRSSAAAHVVERRFRVDCAFEMTGPATVEIAAEAHGPPGAPPVVVLGGISADHHLLPTPSDPSSGWWRDVVGPRRPIDTRRVRAIGVDFVGTPGTVTPAGAVTTNDQAQVLLAVLDRLGADRVEVVGASYGGMVALAAATLEPDRVAGLVVACAAHRPHPMATALRALQRSIALSAPDTERAAGTALARALAMTTYRSALEFDERFDHVPEWVDGRAVFPVEAYLTARGEAFAGRFGADRFARLSESIDTHDIDPAAVVQRTTLVSVDSDAVVPPFLADELAARAPGIERHVRVRSRYGHDAFLIEADAFGAAIAEHFGDPERRP